MSIEKRKAKYFTEFRHKDYYTPRSMREAYGFEPMLYVREKKKEYLTKRGEVPVKKDEYIERIARLLDVNSDMLESLEKVNKSVLALIERRLTLN